MGQDLWCGIARLYSNSHAIGQKSHQSHQNPGAENGSPYEYSKTLNTLSPKTPQSGIPGTSK